MMNFFKNFNNESMISVKTFYTDTSMIVSYSAVYPE